MSTEFTPSSPVDMSSEKTWAADIGMLDWDSTNIVFTKRSLLEFLKYTGTTVDTNFANIQKLPKYATFGTFPTPLLPPNTDTKATVSTSKGSDAFVPTRRVRDPPGGASTDIFGSAFQDPGDDALSLAPKIRSTVNEEVAPPAQPNKPKEEQEEEMGIPFASRVIPSRRVRDPPGGPSKSFWDVDTSFKPKPGSFWDT